MDLHEMSDEELQGTKLYLTAQLRQVDRELETRKQSAIQKDRAARTIRVDVSNLPGGAMQVTSGEKSFVTGANTHVNAVRKALRQWTMRGEIYEHTSGGGRSSFDVVLFKA